MAKKSKKRKRRRHQMKKSRKGQVRGQSRRTRDAFSLEHGGGLSGPDIVFMSTSDSDVPLAEDGYRIVGPSQALVDYAKPFIDEAKSEEDLNKGFMFAQMLWNFALLRDKDPEKFEEGRLELVDMFDVPEAEGVINAMLERFDRMFPFVGKEPAFYVRERVIDIEEYEPFDESTLHISKDSVPPTDKEKELAEALSKIDPEEDEDELSEWRTEVLNCYVEWCVAKGVPDDQAGDFAYLSSSYIDFLKDYHREVVSADTPAETIEEFLRAHFIRKTAMEAQRKSMMPSALKLFMQYLDEKGIVPGTKRVRRIIESEQDVFQKNLKLFTDPSQGRKLIPFRRK